MMRLNRVENIFRPIEIRGLERNVTVVAMRLEGGGGR